MMRVASRNTVVRQRVAKVAKDVTGFSFNVSSLVCILFTGKC